MRSWYQKSPPPVAAALEPPVGSGFCQNPPPADIKICISKKTERISLKWIYLTEDSEQLQLV